MLTKTFSNGAGGYSGGCIDYLADGERKINPETGEITDALAEYDEEGKRLVTREGATLLSGDLELTQELINQASAKFKRGYTAGVLSFEESNIPMSEKISLMESFEEALLPGLEHGEYNIAWIEHTDKGRLELNWVIPKMHIETGAHLQPYYHDIDSTRIKHWQEAQNAQYGYSSPDEPEKRHVMTYKIKDTQDRKEIKTAIDGLLTDSNPQNRADVVDELNAIDGVEVVREVKKSISIKVDGLEKNIRLTGAYFEHDFRADRGAEKEIRREQSRFSKTAKERFEHHNGRYKSRLRTASERNRAKYDRIARNITERNREGAEGQENAEMAITISNDFDAISNDIRGVERDVFPRTEVSTRKAKLHEQANKHDLQRKTEQKIRSVFNDKRANNQVNNRRRNQTFAEFTALTTRVNSQSTKVNGGYTERARDYTHSLKRTIREIGKKAEQWARKAYQASKARKDKGHGYER